MASAADAQILADANARLNKNYTSLEAYLTDNGRLKKDGPGYNRRLADVKNRRGVQKRRKYTTTGKWIDDITAKYGWLVNVYNTNPEIAQIMRDAYIYDQPESEVQANIQRSKWATGLQVGEYDYLKGTYTKDRAYLDQLAAKETEIAAQAAASGYNLTSEQSKLLAAGAVKAGWSGQTLANEIGKAVVAGAKQGTTMAPTPTGAEPTELQQGMDAAGLRTLARSYGIKLTDQDVEGYVQSILGGQLSTQQVEAQFKNQAKNLYPALAQQLDAGTLNDAVSSYRSIASDVLGVDPSAVDFTDATKYGKLLTYSDPKSGQARLMNASEWTQYLRSLPEWQNTSQAKAGYDNLIKSVEMMFGKVG